MNSDGDLLFGIVTAATIEDFNVIFSFKVKNSFGLGKALGIARSSGVKSNIPEINST